MDTLEAYTEHLNELIKQKGGARDATPEEAKKGFEAGAQVERLAVNICMKASSETARGE